MSTLSLVGGDAPASMPGMIPGVGPYEGPNTDMTIKRYGIPPSDLEFVKGERALVAVISTDSLDRDFEVVIPAGVDTASFNQNPRVLWAHDYKTMPVAKSGVVKMTRDRRALYAKIWFRDAPFPQEVYEAYRDGFLDAFSVGLRVVSAGDPLPAEKAARPELERCWRVIRRSMLLEFSCLPIPSNPDALQLAVSKGARSYYSWFGSHPEWVPSGFKEASTSPDAPRDPPASTRTTIQLKEARSDSPKAKRGVIAALWMPKDVARDLAIADGEPPESLHCTLAYMGKVEDLSEDGVERARGAIKAFASARSSFEAKINGLGRFTGSPSSKNNDVLYASLDAPELPSLREGLASALLRAGVPIDRTHGFTPHVTLRYLDPTAPSPIDRIDARTVRFDGLAFCVGGDVEIVPLHQIQGPMVASAEDDDAKNAEPTMDENDAIVESDAVKEDEEATTKEPSPPEPAPDAPSEEVVKGDDAKESAHTMSEGDEEEKPKPDMVVCSACGALGTKEVDGATATCEACGGKGMVEKGASSDVGFADLGLIDPEASLAMAVPSGGDSLPPPARTMASPPPSRVDAPAGGAYDIMDFLMGKAPAVPPPAPPSAPTVDPSYIEDVVAKAVRDATSTPASAPVPADPIVEKALRAIDVPTLQKQFADLVAAKLAEGIRRARGGV